MAKSQAVQAVPQNGGGATVATEASMAGTFAGGMHPLASVAFRERVKEDGVYGAVDLEAGTLTIVLPLADFTGPCPVSKPGKDNKPSKSFMLASSGGFGPLTLGTVPAFLQGRALEVNAHVTTLIHPRAPRAGQADGVEAPTAVLVG